MICLYSNDQQITKNISWRNCRTSNYCSCASYDIRELDTETVKLVQVDMMYLFSKTSAGM